MARSGTGRAFVRRTTQLFTNWNKWAPIHANHRGDVCIAQGLPPESELVRLGSGWIAQSNLGGLLATTLPINSALSSGMYLWNGEPTNGKTYIISMVGLNTITGTTTATNISLAVQLNTSNPITPSRFFSDQVIVSLSGKKSGAPRNAVNMYSGFGVAVTNNGGGLSVPFDKAWHYVGNSFVNSNTVSLTASIEHRVYGRYLVPPRGMFAITGQDNTGSAATNGRLVMSWYEVQLGLG